MIKDELIVMLEMAIEENKFERDAFLFSTDIYQEGYLTEAANSTGDSVFKRLIDSVKELIQKLKQKMTTWFQSTATKKKIDNIKKVTDENSELKNQKINVKNNNELVKFQNDTLRKLSTSQNPDKDMEEYDRGKVKIAKRIAIGAGVAITIAAFIGRYALYNKSINDEIKNTEEDIQKSIKFCGDVKYDAGISEEKSHGTTLEKKRYLASLRVHRDKLNALNQDMVKYLLYATNIDDQFNKNWKDEDSTLKSLYYGPDFTDRDYKERTFREKIMNDYNAKEKVLKDNYKKNGRVKRGFEKYEEEMKELTSTVDKINSQWEQLFS